MPSINTELGERALSKMQHEMDWKPLKERCLRIYPTWSSRHVDRILREYQRFLALKVATRDIYDTIVLAPMLLDAMWKQHILSTQQYYADCQMLLQANQILHYNADASINVRQSVREKRMELTKASLCMMFSGMYPLASDTKGIWDYDESMESTMNSGLSSILGDDQEDTTDDFATGTEEDEDEEDTEIEVAPPRRASRSPRKDRGKPRKSKTIPIKAHSMEASVDEKEERRRVLLYIYRAGKVSKLNTHSQETIKNIKAKIHRKTGFSPHQQSLAWDGLALDDSKTVGQYGIPNDATLVLSKAKSKNDKQMQHPINSDIRRSEDETQTEDHDEPEGISPDEERDQPGNRSKHRSPGRRNGSPTHTRRSGGKLPAPMSPRSPRPPKPPRKHTPPHPPYSPTIREDSSYISSSSHSDNLSAMHTELPSATHSAVPHSTIHSESNDPRRRQQALLNKMKIQSRDQHEDHRHEDHHHRQEDSSIEPQSTIPSRPRPKPAPTTINVFCNTIMGFTITLTAKSTDTIEHLKQLIEAQEDIPLRKQILILDGVPLDDSQVISDYTSNSSLHVLLRLQAGSSSVATASSMLASTMSNSNSMITVTRKKNQNRIMSRAGHDPVGSTANHTGVGTGQWR